MSRNAYAHYGSYYNKLFTAFPVILYIYIQLLLHVQASYIASLYQVASVALPLYIMDHKDDDYERVIREIVRLLQQGWVSRLHPGPLMIDDVSGFDATMQLLRFVVQFILQLPEMIMNLDFEQLRQALLSAGQECKSKWCMHVTPLK